MNKSRNPQRKFSFLLWPLTLLITLLVVQAIFAPHAQAAQSLLEATAESMAATLETPEAANALYIPVVQHGEAEATASATPPTKVPTVTSTASPTVTDEPTATTEPTETTEPEPTATTEPTPERLGEELFVESQWQIDSSALAVDAQGGMHLAYVYYEPTTGVDPSGDENPTSAVYAYCAQDCETPAKWKRVSLGEAVSEVQVALTPAGDPRLLLLVRTRQAGEKADQYVYAQCNENCTNAGQWSLGTVVTIPNNLSWNVDPDFNDRMLEPRHSFALDPLGQPRFIYYEYNVEAAPEGIGAYYAACNTDCTNPLSWSHTSMTLAYDQLGTLYWEELHNPALTFTSDGKPRVIAFLQTADKILPSKSIVYYECNEFCDDDGDGTDNWLSVSLLPVAGPGPSDWDIELDTNGGVHAALYVWPAPQNGDSLTYVWCKSDCLVKENWQGVGLGLGDYAGSSPNLALDAEGRPRIAYIASDYESEGAYPALYYGWCKSNCQTANGQWQHKRVENNENLLAEWDAGYPEICVGGFWAGHVPALALGPTGTLHIAYDTNYYGPCEYDEASHTWQEREYNYLVRRTVHTINFTQP